MKTLKSILLLTIILGISNYAIAHVGGHHPEPEAYKVWTFKNGSQITGVFSLVKEGKVYLELEDHTLKAFEMTSISASDLQFVQDKITEINIINAPLEPNHQHSDHAHQLEEVEKNHEHSMMSEFIYFSIIILLAGILLYIILSKVINQNPPLINAITIFFIGSLSILTIISSCKKDNDDVITDDTDDTDEIDFIYSSSPNANDVTEMTSAFAPYANHVSTWSDGTTFYVNADGLVDHEMMKGITAWIDQFPVYQKMTGSNAWQIPIQPSYSSEGYAITDHFRKYAIGVAANGIAIFNPYNATGEISADIGELDEFGGHSGTGDDYHYHKAPTHLDNPGSATIVAYALDGFPVYGALEPDGSAMQDLDPIYHGHEINGSFHYHASDSYPFMINQFRGEVQVDNINDAPYDQITPQPSTTNFRGNPYPLSGGATSTLIDSCIVNGNNNGYTLFYTVDGLSKKVEYHWVAGATDTITFNFFDEFNNLDHNEVWTR